MDTAKKLAASVGVIVVFILADKIDIVTQVVQSFANLTERF